LDTPYHYKDLEGATPTIQVDGSFNPFRMIAINIIQVLVIKLKQQLLGKVCTWIKTRGEFISGILIFHLKVKK
jgi:hypothetical protein